MNIRQTLLQDTEQPKLQVPGKTAQTIGNFHFHFDATSLRETLNVPLGGGGEADFVQQRRMQQVGYGAGFCNRLVEKLDRIGQKFVGWLRACATMSRLIFTPAKYWPRLS